MLTGKLVNKFVRFVFKCYYYLSYRYLNIIISRLKSPGYYYSKGTRVVSITTMQGVLGEGLKEPRIVCKTITEGLELLNKIQTKFYKDRQTTFIIISLVPDIIIAKPGHQWTPISFSNTEPFEKILIKFWTNNKILDKERVIRMNPYLFRFTMLTKPTYCYVRNK